MIKSINTKVFSVLVLSAFVLAGCGKDDEPAPSAELGKGGELLRYIPADTPYAFASLTPLPDDVLDALEPKLDKVLLSYQAVLQEVVAAKMAEASEDEMSAEDKERAEAFVAELSTILSVEGMRGAGIARDSMGAFYGNGLLPVFRIELSDSDLFEGTIARLEEQAGSKMAVGSAGGQGYRYFDADDVRIVIATIGNHAVLSLVPTAFDEAQTAQVLGLTQPESSLADTGTIQKLIADYGLTNHAVGYLDLPAIAERFVGEPTGVDADLMALFDHHDRELSDVCKAEIREVAGIMPRMVAGYTGISVNRFDSKLVMELREDIASGLQLLTAPVPGLGGDSGALMSFGLSLNIGAAREFMEARFDAMEEDPFECEHLADLQNGVASGRQALNQPVPPMIYDFKGFFAVIDEIEGLDVATQTPPTSVDGTFLLAMDNAQNLVNMGAMFSPELAALNLQPDGNPVALDLPQMQAAGMEAFAALTDSALAISVGGDAETQVQSMLAADPSDPSPFLGFSMDAARYYSFMGEAIAAGETGGDDAPTPELQAALNEMMQSVAELYDRMSGDILFTENGIEVNMTETLKD
ncbi:MAG: hypothetical protein GTO71_03580 [Woeseiaceae bacterium]|nr:hypothetical protein [Woeseiaceae bacterium]NIP20191.1 hypothetical protein [Woeseiaceae bacterium]NIS88987.1 hypothetical protein [Woeseiaceae bacterium]